MKKLYSTRDAARFLHTSLNNIEYYINSGLLTPQILDSQRYFTFSSLYNLSAKNRDESNVKTPSSKLSSWSGWGCSINNEDTNTNKSNTGTKNDGLEDINTNFLSDTDKESYESFREEVRKQSSF